MSQQSYLSFIYSVVSIVLDESDYIGSFKELLKVFNGGLFDASPLVQPVPLVFKPLSMSFLDPPDVLADVYLSKSVEKHFLTFG